MKIIKISICLIATIHLADQRLDKLGLCGKHILIDARDRFMLIFLAIWLGECFFGSRATKLLLGFLMLTYLELQMLPLLKLI